MQQVWDRFSHMWATKPGVAFSYLVSGTTAGTGAKLAMTPENANFIDRMHDTIGVNLAEVALIIGIIGTLTTMFFQWKNYRNIKHMDREATKHHKHHEEDHHDA